MTALSLQNTFLATSNDEAFIPLYVIRWKECPVGSSHISLFLTVDDAKQDVEKHFQQNDRNLQGQRHATYPSGPDHAYHIFTISVLEKSDFATNLRQKGKITVSHAPLEGPEANLREAVTKALQSGGAELTVVPFEGLQPKPQTTESFHFSPGNTTKMP